MIINNETTAVNQIDKGIIKTQIFTIRGYSVMTDSDIAAYFGVETGALNRSMKRNIKRFPPGFCFQVTKEELENLRCQSGISNMDDTHGGRRTMPYVYTEQGVAMLTSCLHTDRAISASIQIIEAFVEMKHILRDNQQIIPASELLLLGTKTTQLDNRLHVVEKNMPSRSRIWRISDLEYVIIKA